MDHLPYPPNSPYLPIHVPIFVTGLDGGGTIDCTGTPAWTHARLAFETACNARRPTAENILAQLQYWLYFGLISRLSTRPVDISYFRSDDTVALLQSSQVPKILLNYQPTGEATHDILMEAEREFPWCMEVIRNALGNNLNYDAESVLLSIRVLIETSRRVLAQSETSNASSTTADCVSHGGSHHYPWPSCRLLRDRMKNHDVWCPALRYKILTTYSTSAAYYLSSLPRIRVIEASHAMCTDFECTLWQDESQYVQSHCCENKDCGSMIEMPFQQMKDIINGGSIPILSFEDGQIQPHEAVAELPYMALSHVWSGGLGNPRGNAMWPCQLQRLAEMPGLGQRAIKEETPGEHGPESFFPTVTRAVLDPVGTAMSSETKCFWIDTMCLPKYDENGGFPPGNMENGEFWKLRSAAINRMTQTYAAANFTLVLDPELMSTNIMQGEDMDEEGMLHVFARILCSTWMTRCWTYQEAAMSTKLLVQFADGIFPFSIKRGEILKQVELLRQQHPKDWQWRKSLDVLALMEELSAWFSSLPGTRDAYDLEADGRTVISGSNDPARFTNIWNSVASRSTSRTDDRFRIFSLLTNLRPSEVEAVKNRKIRLKAILKSQKYLPLSMLFLPPMSKKEFEGQEEEEAKEREAEITYGITSEPYEEDPWYPLPHKIRNRPLHGTLGSMSYLEEERCLTFSAGDLETSSGTNRVTLFQITDLEPLTRGCRRVTFEVDSDIKFTATVSSARKGGPYLAGLKRTDSIYLLTNLDPISLYHSQVHYEDFIGVIAKLDEIGSTRRSLRLRCAGRLSCNSRMFPTGTPTIALRQESLAHYDSCKVDCDLSNVPAIQGHRIKPNLPPIFSASDAWTSLGALLVLYYLAFFGLTAIFGSTKTSASFSPGWLAFIGFLFSMRVVFWTMNQLKNFVRGANNLMFLEWVNSLYNPSCPDRARDRHRDVIKRANHQGFWIHMGRIDTAIFIIVAFIFFVVGLAAFKNPDVRWMIPVSLAIVGEVVGRWLAELFHHRGGLFRVLPGSGLAQGSIDAALWEAFYEESTLTRVVKSFFKSTR